MPDLVFSGNLVVIPKADMNEYCDHFVNLTIMRDNVLVRHADK